MRIGNTGKLLDATSRTSEQYGCPQLLQMTVKPRWREDSVRLVQLVKLWISVYGIEQVQLSKEWKASPSTVARFLSGEQMPDGPTTSRIIAWLFDRP